MTLYFNHSIMENASSEKVHDYLEEIIKLKAKSKEEKEIICFSQDFWDVSFSGDNLRNYLCHLSDKEPAKGLITSVMNGPYYYNNIEINKLSTEPDFNEKSFYGLLFNICFKDNQHKLLSLKEEKILQEKQYKINHYIDSNVNFDIFNLIGEKGLEEFSLSNHTFYSIQQVISALEERYSNLIVLESAIKSAKKHDFRGCFVDVYSAIVSLMESELPALLRGENDELRKRKFYNCCGMEISKETFETLNVDRYRKEREFIIPQKGKVLCQWHVKVDGNNTRIHYHIDKDKQQVYIAHCGKHLSTMGYKS